MDFIKILEQELGIEAKKEFVPMQDGDVKVTSADTSALEDWVNFKPSTDLKEGIGKFVKWYKSYYK